MTESKNPIADPRETLRRLTQERGEDFTSLSRLVGRNTAYIQQYIRRGTPKRLPERERRILARHFGVSEQLLGAEVASSVAGGMVSLPPVEAGRGAAKAGLAFAADWLARLGGSGADALRLATVAGDVMAPTLSEGDDLIVDVEDGAATLRDGLYLLALEDRREVRRLTLHPVRAEVTVQSDNPAYADWPGVAPAELQVIGRVVWAGRRFA